jgi:hypothetical protein
MLYSIRKSVTTHGTPEAFTSDRVIASWCTAIADINNSGPVYIGGLDPDTKSCGVKNQVDNTNLYVGHLLLPGDFMNIREMGGVTYLDLRQVFIDADNSGDSCLLNFGKR